MAQDIIKELAFDIDNKPIISEEFIVENRLIVNSKRGNLLKELKESLSECKSFYFSVAFVNFSGLQLLLDSFKELDEINIKGKILTSTYLNFTDPKALRKVKEFNNIDLKVFIADKEKGFHTKAYIFENEDNYKIIIGSSNITQRALKSNVEWNVMIVSKKETEFVQEVLNEYDSLWNGTGYVDEEFLNTYEKFIKTIRTREKKEVIDFSSYKIIEPNLMQEKALKNLNRLRSSGENKALVIAATGTGKTYMSAFDVQNFNAKRMLFIVHKEEILKDAKDTFQSICKNKNINMGFYTGNEKNKDADYLFATIQTMERHFEEFNCEDFDYIVIDEAHHSTSPSYSKVLNYFKPKFLLGMTATPERCDKGSVFDVFDNNVAVEIRLNEALENELIVPFHYFGITDIDDVNYKDINLDDIPKVAEKLMINSRVDFIIDKMNFYGFDGTSQKTIGFCVNKAHAEYMANKFNEKGIESAVLTGDDSIEKRQEYVEKLESEDDSLKVIFTVDIFNEGIDIPSINQILMLRPTNSPIIFIQQLGRGLRKYESKEFLTVLDFIGNHNRAFLIALALKGSKYYDKDSLKVSVAQDFSDIPGCTNIQMDRIIKEEIIKQLNQENFNSLRYLKEEYKEFKMLLGGKIPFKLMDYITYEGSPNPLRFIDYSKTYEEFLEKVEPGYSSEVVKDEEFMKVLKEFSGMLPLRRPYEFLIIRELLNKERMSVEEAERVILKYLDSTSRETIIHAFRNLSQEFYDSAQKKSNIKLFDYKDNILFRLMSFDKMILNKEFREKLEDVLNYGIMRYEKNFGSVDYGMPFFKLYEQYSMIDTALLSNYEKSHSAFRGSGLLTNGNDFFLYVDLHKDEDIKESINYKDEFISRDIFQWQTPNNTSQDSERGKNIIHNKERNINLHIFIRKYKKIDGKVQPYVYIGKADTIEFEGEKPITVKMKLQNRVPESLYVEFTKKV